MENCSTGTDRLAAPLSPGHDVIGHKTGTGDRNDRGLIIGINDVGYVHLSDGRKYYIAVFISDCGYDMTETSRMIADISKIVLEYRVVGATFIVDFDRKYRSNVLPLGHGTD